MGKTQSLPILITGGGRRIGLALAWHFINQKQPVIVSYRTHYPAIDGLIKAGAQCIQADFSTNDGVMAFADEVLKSTHGLRAILHNASAWMAEKPGAPLTDVLAVAVQRQYRHEQIDCPARWPGRRDGFCPRDRR